MSLKVNLNIVIIFLLILLFLLIMFKDNLKSKFVKYVNRGQPFSNMQDSNGNTSLYFNDINMGDLTINYKLKALTNYWKDTTVVGAGAGTIAACWYKWPMVYIFDPTGQAAAADKLEGSYQSGGNMYSVFNKSMNSPNSAFRTTIYANPTSTSTTQANPTSTPFTELNFPQNLIKPTQWMSTNQNASNTTTVTNMISYWSATTTGGVSISPKATGADAGFLDATADITMGITFPGSTFIFWSPMVSGRTYIIGISNLSTAMRKSTNPPSTTWPYIGLASPFIYKSFIASAESGVSVVFNNVSAATMTG